MAFVYATPGSGPSAGGIGWFDFTGLNLGQQLPQTQNSFYYPNQTGTLADGTTVTFDLTVINPISAYTQQYFQPFASPLGAFGSGAYTGIPGEPLAYVSRPFSLYNYIYPNEITVTNIVVKDSNGNAVTNYTAVFADGESTNLQSSVGYNEYWTITTDGNDWSLLDTISGNPPAISIPPASQTVSITGVNVRSAAAYVLTTQNPQNLTFTTLGHQAFAFGFAVTRVELIKNVSARLNPSDQFQLEITGGTPSSTVTTTGGATGIQSEVANVFTTPGTSYTVTELMAAGSVSTLSNYTQTITSKNLSLNQTVPGTGPIPISTGSLELGDILIYTILNSVPEIFTKTVNTNYANVGDVVTYTITVTNPNNFAVTNVLVTDPLPAGLSFINLVSVVGSAYTGTNPATGITLTSIAANSSATITWTNQVIDIPAPNPIVNTATIAVAGPVPDTGSTNSVSTQVNNADITLVKSAININ